MRDETAATRVGDRRAVAQALAQAALARTTSQAPGNAAAAGVLQLDGTPIAARARAMLLPAPRPRRLLAAALTVLAFSPALSALGIGLAAESHFERAHARCAPASASSCL